MSTENETKISPEMKLLQSIHQIIFGLEYDNIEASSQTTVEFFDQNFPITFNLVIIQNIHTAYCVQYKNVKIYLNYLEIIEDKEGKILNKNPKIIRMLIDSINKDLNELKYLYADLVNSGVIEQKPDDFNMKIFNSIKNYDLEEIMKYNNNLMNFLNAVPIISIILQKDDVDKLQEISTHANFDINQKIKSSFYEKCLLNNPNGITLIDYAAYFGSIKCFKYLLLNGSKIENTGKYAVAGGNIEIIHLCEQNHATFKGSCEAAIQFHRNDIFHYIYKKNYLEPDNINQNYFFDVQFEQLTEEEEEQQNRLSKLAIKCVQYNNYEIFLFLEENGLIINKDIVYKTLRKGNLYLAKYIMKGKEFPNNSLVYACASSNIELVNCVFKNCDFDINGKDKDGSTALKKVICNNQYDLVKLLLEQKGIDVNIQDQWGSTPLMYASQFGHTDIVKLLLEHEGIDVNIQNKNKKTALMIASNNGHTEIVKLLLKQKGIDVNIPNYEGRTALQMAFQPEHEEIIKLLLQHEGIDVTTKDENNCTILMSAVKHGSYEMVKLLLEQEGIDINAKDNDDGKTALIIASANGNIEIVKLLIEQEGIDINAKDNDGFSAIINAAKFGKKEIIDVLKEIKGIEYDEQKIKEQWGNEN